MDEDLKAIHLSFIGFAKRAEKNSAEILYDTFVDTEPLVDILLTKNNQIIYGRRGTGKTHALKYIAQRLKKERKFPIYIDLRSIGSNGSLYHDASRPVLERSVRLILDLLAVVGDELYEIAIDKISGAPHPDQIGVRLDDFVASISDVKIVGEHTEQKKEITRSDASNSASASASVGLAASIGIKASHSEVTKTEGEGISTVKGYKESYLQFGRVQGCLKSLLEILGNPQIWVLIDEWSEVPLELQPFLADLLRKTLLPIDNFVIKIAAIEHRTRFYESKEHGEYIGLELGADISADLNLDDFLVFDNDQKKSVEFFKNLLFRHLSTSANKPLELNSDDFIKITFTQTPVFEEFVRAAEGVPRDALNLAAKMASKAFGKSIAMADVRTAARDWYQSDKAAAVQANQSLAPILGHIVDTVIGKRRARAFLFPANVRNEHIERLFDARILHLRKRNISSNETPGKRYDAYKIDYGCYVDLINTQKSTQGFFEVDDSGFVEVPADDYRSIRRAILKPEELEGFAEREKN